jgi:hypothetical protein
MFDETILAYGLPDEAKQFGLQLFRGFVEFLKCGRGACRM